MVDKIAIAELEREKETLLNLMPKLGKHKIRELRRTIDLYYRHRFDLKNKIPKYGSLNKGFTDAQLQAFFFVVDKPKYKLLFSYMAYVGLRIGEAVKVNRDDIDFATRELRIRSEKTKKLDLLIIPLGLFQQTQAYVEGHNTEIDRANGYLFFKDSNEELRSEPYLESNYARKVFCDYRHKANLDEVYDTSEESVEGRGTRRLHLLTTHSLRHHAITTFYNQTKNWLMTSKFARHLAPSTTTTYIHTDKDELYAQIDKVFSN